ncbi:MAG: hypothetical protein WD335_01130 [Candidatus Paceibacterota bacterium]
MENDIKDIFLVEFIGLPGAGKTTTAAKVYTKLLDSGYRCSVRESMSPGNESSIIDRFIYGIYFVCSHPLKVTKIFLLSLYLKKPSKFFLLLKVFISQFRNINNKNIHYAIYDQGIFNMLLYIGGENTNWKKIIKIYTKLLPVNLCFIVLEISIEKAIKRAKNRKLKRHFTKQESDKRIRKIYSKYNENIRFLLSDLKNTPYLNLNMKSELDYNVDKTTQFLSKLRKT